MYKIRKLKRSDFTAYCENEVSYYKELRENPAFGTGTYGKKIKKRDMRVAFTKLYKAAAAHNAVVVVAENEAGKMVGIGELNGHAWVEAPHIADMGISLIKGYRGMGIGTAMAKRLLKMAKGKYEIITAGTFSRNTASKRLLKRLGFRRWGLGSKFVKRGKLYMDSELFYLRLK
jgi:RimJ/RimL family protein N-acetyltransferase